LRYIPVRVLFFYDMITTRYLLLAKQTFGVPARDNLHWTYFSTRATFPSVVPLRTDVAMNMTFKFFGSRNFRRDYSALLRAPSTPVLV